jgi:hypothetical protein
MAQEFISFGFSIPNVWKEGFAEVSGLAKVSGLGLILEFEGIQLGKPKSSVREVQIPFAEIDSADLKAGWLKTEMIVKTRSLNTLNAVPGSVQGSVTLRVPRKEKEAARRAFSALRMKITEIEIERLRQASDGLAGDDHLTGMETKLLP